MEGQVGQTQRQNGDIGRLAERGKGNDSQSQRNQRAEAKQMMKFRATL